MGLRPGMIAHRENYTEVLQVFYTLGGHLTSFFMYAWNNLLLIKCHIFLLLYVFQKESVRNIE
jgi:hypothetical protein